MNVIHGKPPVWDNICAAFKITPGKGVFFTYGDTIYYPGGDSVPDYILIHEAVHGEQQNHNDKDAALWWGKYLRDPKFRLDQEARAYGAQYKFHCKKIKDRNKLALILHDISVKLSGPLYGRCIEHSEAMILVKHYANL